MVELFLSIFSVVGSFAVIDSFMTPHARGQISNYIFGLHGIRAKAFEQALVTAWVSSFFRGGRIRVIRTYLLAILTSLALISIPIYHDGFSTHFPKTYFFFIALPVLGAFGFPFEYLNLHVSRQVYFGFGQNLHFLVQYLSDIILTATISISLMIGVGMLHQFKVFPRTFFYEIVDTETILLGLVIGSIISTMGFLFCRGVVLLAATAMRSFLMFTNVNLRVAIHSNVYHQPLAYLSLVAMILGHTIVWILG